MARVLSGENMALLKVARDQQPDSMVTLARDCIQFAMYVGASYELLAGAIGCFFTFFLEGKRIAGIISDNV